MKKKLTPIVQTWKADEDKINLTPTSTQEIKDEIARTQIRMHRHLSELGRKLKPRMQNSIIWISSGIFILAAGGFAVYRKLSAKSKMKV